MRMTTKVAGEVNCHAKERQIALYTDIFLICDEAIRNSIPITRVSDKDKEFHFQNWFEARLTAVGIPFDPPARNTYPDYRLVQRAEGYELKGLAYPGREANYDCNSQVPTGMHNGRSIYYVFGRYPKDDPAKQYPILDLVVCNGDFLNATHDYVHKNKNVKGFGSYGDVMIRDRKMYVAPTPFGLTDGTARQCTLILRDDEPVDDRLVEVGKLIRVESDRVLVRYAFDLVTNEIVPGYRKNPTKGTRHTFIAYRHKDAPGPLVTLKNPAEVIAEMEQTEKQMSEAEQDCDGADG